MISFQPQDLEGLTLTLKILSFLQYLAINTLETKKFELEITPQNRFATKTYFRWAANIPIYYMNFPDPYIKSSEKIPNPSINTNCFMHFNALFG